MARCLPIAKSTGCRVGYSSTVWNPGFPSTTTRQDLTPLPVPKIISFLPGSIRTTAWGSGGPEASSIVSERNFLEAKSDERTDLPNGFSGAESHTRVNCRAELGLRLN